MAVYIFFKHISRGLYAILSRSVTIWEDVLRVMNILTQILLQFHKIDKHFLKKIYNLFQWVLEKCYKVQLRSENLDKPTDSQLMFVSDRCAA